MADLTYATDDEPKGVVRGFLSGGLSGGVKGALVGALTGAAMVGSGVLLVGTVGSLFGAGLAAMSAIAVPAAWIAGGAGVVGAISGAGVGTPIGSVLGAFNGHAAGQRFERQAAMREKLASLGLAAQANEAVVSGPQVVPAPQVAAVPQVPASTVVADNTVKLAANDLASQGLRPIGINGERSEGHVDALLASGYQAPLEGNKVAALTAQRARAPETQAQVG